MLLCLSCRVLEDRAPCPCMVDLVYAGKAAEDVLLVFWHEDRFISSDVLDWWACDEVYRTKLSKGKNGFCAIKGGRSLVHDSPFVSIPYGRDMDSLYACSALLDCRGEYVVDTVCLHKQFASLEVRFRNMDSLGEDYSLELSSKVAGLYVPDLRPMHGDFLCSLKFCAESGAYRCRLPRQNGDSLELHLLKSGDGGLVDTIDLGGIIRGSGYDWQAEDLKDISLELDFARVEPETRIEIWDDISLGKIEY